MATRAENTSSPPPRQQQHPAAPGATPPEAASPDPVNLHEDVPGHPNARGTLPMARELTDLATEDEIQALARTAPPMTTDQAIQIARLLHWNRNRQDRAA
ncbi:MAG TPA: hypothetical protein VJT31_01550 [Rugosimonospora sp.]|nr:hypothetical protein [Rugosimonospora sp.]